MAQRARLKNALIPESPEICFIPERQYREFLTGKVSSKIPEHADDPMEEEAGPGTLVRAGDLCYSWIESIPAKGMKVRARIRSAMNESEAVARITEDGILEVQLEHPLRAAVPGQSIVLYDGDMVAMGGIIKEKAC